MLPATAVQRFKQKVLRFVNRMWRGTTMHINRKTLIRDGRDTYLIMVSRVLERRADRRHCITTQVFGNDGCRSSTFMFNQSQHGRWTWFICRYSMCRDPTQSTVNMPLYTPVNGPKICCLSHRAWLQRHESYTGEGDATHVHNAPQTWR